MLHLVGNGCIGRGIGLQEVVGDDEKHGGCAKEDGQREKIAIGNHGDAKRSREAGDERIFFDDDAVADCVCKFDHQGLRLGRLLR